MTLISGIVNLKLISTLVSTLGLLYLPVLEIISGLLDVVSILYNAR